MASFKEILDRLDSIDDRLSQFETVLIRSIENRLSQHENICDCPKHKKGYYAVWDYEKPNDPLVRYWNGKGWFLNHLQKQQETVEDWGHWENKEFIE